MFRVLVLPLFLSFFLSAAGFCAPPELPVTADRCAIHFALTGMVDEGCVAPDVATLGAARRLPPAGFDRGAVGLDSVPQEQGYFIRFPFNSADLTAEYQAHLERLGQILAAPKLAQHCIKLVGHADSVGGPAFNMRLSQQRAQTVANVLVEAAQVTRARIAIEGQGERALIGGIPGPHPLNRRVEIMVRRAGGDPC
ncbi:OmpA family protein [Shimia sp. R11_0]|uniref:OmpA family protein n=1 Tax=Shimia sp. R11_0 TaxID=2821096 RepID=UPI001ADB4A2C|nr:OmpA family protein [Shimia sp. R11_0]MBO9479767.1 OmpA family protein [Shimia sp. R11_0]